MNKRIAPRRTKTVQQLATQQRPTPLPQLRSRSRELQQEIHRLECTIAAAPHLMRRQKLAARDTLPAPEERSLLRARPIRSPKRLPLQQQKAIQRRRMALMLELSLIVMTLIGGLGWLKQWLSL